jgi:hypothetical protein
MRDVDVNAAMLQTALVSVREQLEAPLPSSSQTAKGEGCIPCTTVRQLVASYVSFAFNILFRK